MFNITPGIKFWNGTPLTAADVVFSLERNTDPNVAGFYAAVFNRVKSITQTGNLQVTITLKQPDYWLEGELSSTPGFIISKAFAEKVGTAKYGTVATDAMCTGPYELGTWNSNELVAKANPNYWNTALKPQGSELVFKPVSTDQAATEALQTGELTGDYPLNISTLDQLKADSNLNVYLGPSYASDAFIVSGAKGSAISNPKVRQALSLAIDRQGFINATYKGAAHLPNTLANPGTWGYGKQTFQNAWNALGPPKQNLAKAKQLIQQAGATGKTVTIGMSSELNTINTEAIMFQSAGAVDRAEGQSALGLGAELHQLLHRSQGAGRDRRVLHRQLPRLRRSGRLSTTRLVIPDGSQNYDGFSDPNITAAMKPRGRSHDPDKRAQDVVTAQKGIMQQLPWIPVAVRRPS